jgi:hypothetical protein
MPERGPGGSVYMQTFPHNGQAIGFIRFDTNTVEHDVAGTPMGKGANEGLLIVFRIYANDLAIMYIYID